MKGKTDKKLEQKNIKPTAMRQLVYEILEKQKKALSLYEIERKHPSNYLLIIPEHMHPRIWSDYSFLQLRVL